MTDADPTRAQMRAVVWTAYGGPDVLRLERVDEPVVSDDDILIRVRATTVTAGDVELRGFAFRNILTVPLRLFFGVVRPRRRRILGQEMAGEVIAIGRNVTRYEVGDRVFAHAGLRFGGYAERASLPEKGMMGLVPNDVSFEAAATIPTAGAYGLYFVRQAGIKAGDAVLVNGGCGAIGTYAVQLAKAAGASVTVVDHGDKADYARRIGADEFVDYATDDFTTRRDSFDIILDVVDKSSFSKASRALRPGGRYFHTNLSLSAAVRRALTRKKDDRQAAYVRDTADPSTLEELADMLAAGTIQVPIDRRFTLPELVEAHRYAETGAKTGHIVVTI